jgi:hypothetical protein
MSQISVPQFVRGLTNLSALLEKAEAYAVQTGMTPEAMLGAQLAPDMLPLTGQVQRASDTAKFAVQRISGEPGPSFADDETTFAQLQARIANTIAYIENADVGKLDDGIDREIKINWTSPPTTFSGMSYLLNFALPNFYFHIATAHGILRNQGVGNGKRDYLGPF